MKFTIRANSCADCGGALNPIWAATWAICMGCAVRAGILKYVWRSSRAAAAPPKEGK